MSAFTYWTGWGCTVRFDARVRGASFQDGVWVLQGGAPDRVWSDLCQAYLLDQDGRVDPQKHETCALGVPVTSLLPAEQDSSCPAPLRGVDDMFQPALLDGQWVAAERKRTPYEVPEESIHGGAGSATTEVWVVGDEGRVVEFDDEGPVGTWPLPIRRFEDGISVFALHDSRLVMASLIIGPNWVRLVVVDPETTEEPLIVLANDVPSNQTPIVYGFDGTSFWQNATPAGFADIAGIEVDSGEQSFVRLGDAPGDVRRLWASTEGTLITWVERGVEEDDGYWWSHGYELGSVVDGKYEPFWTLPTGGLGVIRRIEFYGVSNEGWIAFGVPALPDSTEYALGWVHYPTGALVFSAGQCALPLAFRAHITGSAAQWGVADGPGGAYHLEQVLSPAALR